MEGVLPVSFHLPKGWQSFELSTISLALEVEKYDIKSITLNNQKYEIMHNYSLNQGNRWYCASVHLSL